MSFGESTNLQGLFRKICKETSLEGSRTQRDLAPKKESSRRIKDPPGQSGPRGGPHQTDRPSGGAGLPRPGAKWARLLECSSTAYEDQSKPQVKVSLIVRCTSSPLDYISRPPDPRADNSSCLSDIRDLD
jgi:hypothetical protein